MKILVLIFTITYTAVYLFRTLPMDSEIFFKKLFWEVAVATFWGIVAVSLFWSFITFQYHIGAIKVL